MKKSDLKRVVIFLNETRNMDLDCDAIYEDFNSWDNSKKTVKSESNEMIKKEVYKIIENHSIVNSKERLNVYRKKYLCYFLKEKIDLNLSYVFISELIDSTHRNVISHVKTAKDLIDVNDKMFSSYTQKLKEDLEQIFKTNIIK